MVRPVVTHVKESESLFGAPGAEHGVVDLYLSDLRHEDRISDEQERVLGRRARAGDEEAIEHLVRANLRFVITIAKKYRNRGIPMSDLIQEGNAGLVIAARKFDPDQGVKFISYAVWWIRHRIRTALAGQSRPFRLPTNRAGDMHRLHRTRERYRQELGRDASQEELAQELGLSQGVVQTLLSLDVAELRLDAPLRDREDASLMDRFVQEGAINAEEEVEQSIARDTIDAALSSLPERDAYILRLYFGLINDQTHTLEEIGGLLGLTRERVRQLRDRALRRLREGAHADTLSTLW